MSEHFYINIGRQPGSGGRKIGEKLARQMGIAFYDKELILIASRESGLKKGVFEQMDEKAGHSIFGGLFGLRSSLIDEIYSGFYLSNESLFQIQSDVIRQLARKGPSLFVGRCTDYVLKDYKRCLNIFISAHLEDRIKTMVELKQIPEKKAVELIEKMDRKRAAYYNYFSNKEWGNAKSYHLCINSSVLGIDGTIEFIQKFAEKQFGLKKTNR